HFSPDGKNAVSASVDGTAVVWTTSDAFAEATSRAISDRWANTANSDSFDRSGRWAAHAWDERTVVWELERATTLPPLPGAQMIAFGSRGERLAMATSAAATVRDVASGRLVLAVPSDAAISAVAMAGDATLLVATKDHNLRVWDVDQRRERGRIKTQADVTA